MPHWTDFPPSHDNHKTFRLTRTPPSKPLQGIITCHNPIGTYTHFAHHRTVPCEAPNECTFCAAGYPKRWHGYISLLLTDTLEHVLFEYTAAASSSLEHYLRHQNTLRGAILTAKRVTPHHNARVIITLRPSNPTTTKLPDPPDIKQHLCTIWNIRNDHEQPNQRYQNLAHILKTPNDDTDGRYRIDPHEPT